MAGMSTAGPIPEPLTGNPARQADALNRGLTFQIWCSVEAWINLTDEHVLVLEGVEDFDIVDPANGTGVQTKATAKPMTLRSSAVVELLVNHWAARSDNPGRRFYSRLVTTSTAGLEDGGEFGAEGGGIAVWRNCVRQQNLSLAERLRAFLVSDPSISGRLNAQDTATSKAPRPNLLEFLRTATAQQAFEELIARITLDTGSPDADVVRESIRASLHAHGERLGMRPGDCDPALDRLFRVAAETASRKDNRILTRSRFRTEFEAATTRPMTPREIAGMQMGDSAPPQGIAQFGLLAGVDLLVHRQPPDLPDTTLPRTALVRKLATDLASRGTLVLQGSSGMGKSTLATLAARDLGGAWLWTDFQGVPPTSVPLVVRALAAAFAQSAGAINLALDNLHFEAADLTGIEDALAAMTRIARIRGGRVLLCVQRTLPQRLRHKMEIAEEDVQTAPRLEIEEIRQLCEILGCPSAELAGRQAKMVHAKTSGHPRLVHARLAGLAHAKWPAPAWEDFTGTPPEISEELEITRQLLDRTIGADKELLYRLSISSGPFRREYAIALGQHAPALDYPADSFDRLVGPWIDSLRNGYYRLSPLLSNAAESNWPVEKINAMRGAYARAMLNSKSKTLLEASEVLLQGILAKDEEVVTAVAVSLAQVGFDKMRAVADALAWLSVVARKKGGRLFNGNPHVNFLVRVLQFRIMAVEGNVRADELCAVVDADFADTSQGLSRESRCMWVTTVLNYFQAPVSPRRLVAYWTEARTLFKGLPNMRRMNANIVRQSKELPDLPAMDFDGHLLLMVVTRDMSSRQLVEMAEAMNALPGEARSSCIKYLGLLAFPLRLAIERVAIGKPDHNAVHWDRTVKDLQGLAALTKDWDLPAIGASIVRTLAAIHDEHQGNPDRSLAVLDEFRPRAKGVLYLVDDQRAFVLSRRKEHRAALDIWQSTLPTWPVPSARTSDRSWFYASQRAGNCAGELKDWAAAIGVFGRARGFAEQTSDRLGIAVFLADEAFAQWKNNDKARAVRLAGESLLAFERIEPHSRSELSVHRARKFFEQVLKWFRHQSGVTDEGEVWEPPAGLCSRMESDDRIKDYPACPFDLLWYYVCDIEERTGSGDWALQVARKRRATSRFTLFRGIVAQMSVRHAFVRRDFGDLISEVVNVVQGLADAEAQVKSGRSAAEPDAFPTPKRADALHEITEAITAGVLFLHAAGRPLTEYLGPWRTAITTLPERSALEPILHGLAQVASAPESELGALFSKHAIKAVCGFAAIRLSAHSSQTIESVLAGQIAITATVSNSPYRRQIEATWGELMRAEWRRRIAFPAQFPTPRLTIPPIQAVCNEPTTGLKLSARLLLEVRHASGMPIRADIIEGCRRLADL